MYSNASRRQDLKTLLSLVDNQSEVTLQDVKIGEEWVTKPRTLGEVVVVQILSVVHKKLEYFIFNANNLLGGNNKILEKEFENFILHINEIDFINRILHFLDSNSDTKKDLAILILIRLTSFRYTLNMMMTREFLKRLIDHINRFKKISIFIFIFCRIYQL
jgi:hypothetical protein